MNIAFRTVPVAIAFLLIMATSHAVAQAAPYQATGFKVGEVTDTSAIVWTRLTLRKNRNPSNGPMVEIVYADKKNNKKGRSRNVTAVKYPAGVTVSDIRNAVPGTTGQVRVSYRSSDQQKWNSTAWNSVDPKRDFTHQDTFKYLSPNTRYQVRVETRKNTSGPSGQTLDGSFRTAPKANDPSRVVFTVSTGQAYNDQDRPDGYNIYPEMLKLDPNFFVHTGDIVYYDRLAKTEALARYHWQRTYSLPTNVNFHRQVASYFIKDDHDAWVNDCWPTMNSKYMYQFTFKQGLAIFPEQVPMGKKTYRTRRWGKDLQIWMVEGRDFRSPNTDPDGPDKTIWGKEQKEWFKRTVKESDATFRILISPTPMVGPDRDNKRDNHSNKVFKHEGSELLEFISQQKNLVVVCGDRHWQYMSIHPKTKVREYSCGPASDKHAGGWQKDDFRADYHQYLNVIGGFLSATVERDTGKPTLTFRYHDSKGKVNYTDRLESR
jgi:alkaline phosphatase D